VALLSSEMLQDVAERIAGGLNKSTERLIQFQNREDGTGVILAEILAESKRESSSVNHRLR
jgi:hypothetical protein